ncbi:unnamed protein product [Ectocarpus sp. 4 AP-2014]
MSRVLLLVASFILFTTAACCMHKVKCTRVIFYVPHATSATELFFRFSRADC